MTPLFKMVQNVRFIVIPLTVRLSVSHPRLVISCHEAAAQGKNELLSRCVPNVDIDLNYL